MISKKKFLNLKPTTQIFKICNELELLRDGLISDIELDLSALESFYNYILDSNKQEIAKKIGVILADNNKRSLLENIHFLLHELREKVGYPISEKQFIKSSKDKIEILQEKKNDLIIILENLRSAFNVGSIIRSSECFGIKKIISTGLTPQITDSKVIKTAKDTERNVDFSFTEDIALNIKELKNEGYYVIGAETGKGSVKLSDHEFIKKTAVIFGNEEIGLTQKVIDLCDAIVEIDMKGLKNSLNVSNAASIFMFEYVKQL